jgi:uncharacterized protein YjbJ (UPF0337 family)
MNKDQVKGRVNTATGKIKEEVGKATNRRTWKPKASSKGWRQSAQYLRRRQGRLKKGSN